MAAPTPSLRTPLHAPLLVVDESHPALVRRADREVDTAWHTPLGAQLETSIREWIRIWNAELRPYVWTKSADEIFGSLGSYLQRISGTAD